MDAITFVQLTHCGKEIILPEVELNNGKHTKIFYFNPYDVSYFKSIKEELNCIVNSYEYDWIHKVETVIVPATKPIPIAFYLADLISANLLILKKEVKPYHKDIITFESQSITSSKASSFFIEKQEISMITNKNVLFFDDVISTGETYLNSRKMIESFNPKSFHELFLFIEGPTMLGSLDKNSYCGKIPLI